MKKTLVLLFSLLQLGLFAQQDMVWDAHGIGFKVPSNFKEETNNQDEFTASNDNLFLSIIPFQDENVTTDNLAAAILDIARDLKYDQLSEVDKLDIQDFTGYYVLGKKDGVNALVMALLDTESSTNMIVVIAYDDRSERAAINIANSFYAYD